MHFADQTDYLKKCKLARQKHAVTVFGQCFSPCGTYLVAGTNFGHIVIYNLLHALGPEATEESCAPSYISKIYDGHIYDLKSTEEFLICSGNAGIIALSWKDVINKKPIILWKLNIPMTENRLDIPEINTIAIDKQENSSYLYAGCGDNLIHKWDIESGRKVSCLKGHKNYIHKIYVKNNGRECISASEDGSVRIWDARSQKEQVGIIEPYTNDQCVRPNLGKWISCLDVDSNDDWIVCGGGPKLSLWRLRSVELTAVYEAHAITHHDVMFHDDTIISGGGDPFVYHWDLNGVQRAKVPCSPSSVFNIAVNCNNDTTKVLSIAGNCNNIDICTNFAYRAFSFNVL